MGFIFFFVGGGGGGLMFIHLLFGVIHIAYLLDMKQGRKLCAIVKLICLYVVKFYIVGLEFV